MLEESKMDKKSINRSSQSQSRASAIDCKKPELTHKPWPRNNKKREVPGTAPKNEPYRKNIPAQRGRGQIDRRPRPRGPTNFSMGGAEDTGLEQDDGPEIGSVFVPGSKKQSGNHLLNFKYHSRGEVEHRTPMRRQVQKHILHRHDHGLYLRAYCQFVVKEGGDYTTNLMNPDAALKWDLVEEIVVRSTGRSECPICLGAPVAGRVSLCGHVYCWPCVLHYAAAHEKQPPPCPVCAMSLQVKDMKPTRMLQWESTNEEVTMRLVRRPRESMAVEVAPPRGQFTESVTDALLPLERMNNAPYSKLFAATKQQVRDILERERKEIQNQILAEIDTTEIVYLEQALEMLKMKEEEIDLQFEPKVKGEVSEDTAPVVYEKLEVNDSRIDWFDVTDEGAACLDIVQDQLEELDIGIEKSVLNPEAPEFSQGGENEPEEFPLIDYPDSPEKLKTVDKPSLSEIDKQNQNKYFYFYQADDGQQVFLHNLNVRTLCASWGGIAAAPLIIRGRVLQRDTMSLTEQTRKHMPHTAHLPLHCSFDVVELDLRPPYVTAAALKNSAEEIDRRARTRARQERDERRRERAYRRAMEGPPRPDFSSEVQFPPAPPSHSSPPLSGPPLVPVEQTSPTDLVSPSSSGMSFAKMASTSGTWRVRKNTQPPTPPPIEDEGSAPRTLSLSDAIEAALQAAPLPSGKKNKKSKQKLLFTTGMPRIA